MALLAALLPMALLPLGSECADVLPSAAYHRQLCDASAAEAEATLRASLERFDAEAIGRRLRDTLHCKQRLCGGGGGGGASRPQTGVPDYIMALAPKCGSSSFHNLLQAHPAIVSSNRKVLPFFVSHTGEVLERCAHGASSCPRQQVAYLPGFGGRANRTADAWHYLCSTTGHYPTPPDSRNHPKVAFRSEREEEAWRGQGAVPLAPDHNPHTLLGPTPPTHLRSSSSSS